MRQEELWDVTLQAKLAEEKRVRNLIVAQVLSDISDCISAGISLDYGESVLDVPLFRISEALDKRAELREREANELRGQK